MDSAENNSEDVPVINGHEVTESTSIPASEYARPIVAHRPIPMPTQDLGKQSRMTTPADAAVVDWERRAYLAAEVDTDHCQTPPEIPVPEYTLAETFTDLPEWDQGRIHNLNDRVVKALENVETTTESIRETVVKHEDDSSVPSQGQIASATRLLLTMGPNAREQISNTPDAAVSIADDVTKMRNTSCVLVDLLSWGFVETSEIVAMREQAVAMVGDAQLAFDSLQSVIIRHPELSISEWQDSISG